MGRGRNFARYDVVTILLVFVTSVLVSYLTVCKRRIHVSLEIVKDLIEVRLCSNMHHLRVRTSL